jgi:hypothetical protein
MNVVQAEAPLGAKSQDPYSLPVVMDPGSRGEEPLARDDG